MMRFSSLAYSALLLVAATNIDAAYVQPSSATTTRKRFDFTSIAPSSTLAFTGGITTKKSSSSTAIYGAFNKRNKQNDLMRKMELAKQQRQAEEGGGDGAEEKSADTKKDKKAKRLSDAEIKKQNDLKRFEELLNSESATINNGVGGIGGNYLTAAQEDEEMDAVERGVDRLFEGDPAPAEPFESLVPVILQSNNNNNNNFDDMVIGKNGAERLVPWLHKNSNKQKDYLVVITDPRMKSDELRNAVLRVSKKMTADVLARTIVINADTTGENRRWLKKQKISPHMRYYSDEKLEWMREYSALGEKRWSICMFILADGRVQKLVRDLDPEVAVTVLQTAIKGL